MGGTKDFFTKALGTTWSPFLGKLFTHCPLDLALGAFIDPQ